MESEIIFCASTCRSFFGSSLKESVCLDSASVVASMAFVGLPFNPATLISACRLEVGWTASPIRPDKTAACRSARATLASQAGAEIPASTTLPSKTTLCRPASTIPPRHFPLGRSASTVPSSNSHSCRSASIILADNSCDCRSANGIPPSQSAPCRFTSSLFPTKNQPFSQNRCYSLQQPTPNS